MQNYESYVKIIDADISILKDCASLYCEIWREKPWDEEWSFNNVLKSIKKQAKKNGFKGLIVLLNQKVIGFTWGFPVTKKDIRKIFGGENLDYLFYTTKKIFYIAELGVSIQYRKSGIGKTLTKILLSEARENSRIFILRTDKRAIPAKKLYSKIDFEELMIRDGRHINRTYWIIEDSDSG